MATQPKATSLKLTDDQRKTIAKALGLEDKMHHVPDHISIAVVDANQMTGVAKGLAQPDRGLSGRELTLFGLGEAAARADSPRAPRHRKVA